MNSEELSLTDLSYIYIFWHHVAQVGKIWMPQQPLVQSSKTVSYQQQNMLSICFRDGPRHCFICMGTTGQNNIGSKPTLNSVYNITNFICLANCTHPCSVTNSKCTPNDIIWQPLHDFLGILAMQFCRYYHLLSEFSSKFQSSMTRFHYIHVTMQNISNFVLEN